MVGEIPKRRQELTAGTLSQPEIAPYSAASQWRARPEQDYMGEKGIIITGVTVIHMAITKSIAETAKL